jgi:hypothetical protein
VNKGHEMDVDVDECSGVGPGGAGNRKSFPERFWLSNVCP